MRFLCRKIDDEAFTVRSLRHTEQRLCEDREEPVISFFGNQTRKKLRYKL